MFKQKEKFITNKDEEFLKKSDGIKKVILVLKEI